MNSNTDDADDADLHGSVISEFVFSEVTTVLALRKSMEAAKEVGNVLLEAKEIEIMRASEVFERTWEIFSNQENTDLSFVDASNLACMEKQGITKIATFDRDFLRMRTVEVVGGWVLSDNQEDLRI